MPTDREIYEQFHREFQRLADFERFRLVGNDNGLDAMIGISTRLFMYDGHTASRRRLAIAAMHDYYENFVHHLNYYTDKLGAAHVLSEREGFAYFRSQIDADDPDQEMLSLGLLGFPGGEPDHVPLQFVCSSFMRMPSWTKFGALSEWSAATNFSALGDPFEATLVETVVRWADLVKPAHGTSGISFLLERNQERTAKTVFPLLKQFPGIDMDDAGRWITHVGSERKIRSIGWLTIIDDAFVSDLGGLEAVRRRLGEACPIHVYGGGVVIQAGPKPAIGDANAGFVPEYYRIVARALRAIRFDDYRMGLLSVPEPLDGAAETRAWIRRFD